MVRTGATAVSIQMDLYLANTGNDVTRQIRPNPEVFTLTQVAPNAGRSAIRNRGTLAGDVHAVNQTELKTPTYEPLLESVTKRIHAAVRELRVRGIIDEHGNRIRTDLPEDMKESSERDFGG